jgi:hypothetical protein
MKPRVTDEQAKYDPKVDTETLNRVMASNPEEYDEQAAELLLIIKLYAVDLLDARDIIEKQKVMLQEMREGLVVPLWYNTECKCEACFDHREKISALLEKCKEFA